jgi:PPOX class probable F420-dependent enzyme
VETPIWFARELEHLYLRTGEASAKIRRIRRDSRVELRPSDYRGRYADDAPVVFGTAGICDEEERRHGETCLKERYRWQWNVIPMIPLPGLSNRDPDLTLKERITRARCLGRAW